MKIYYQVPHKLVITAKKAFYSDINFIFRENPEFFTNDVHLQGIHAMPILKGKILVLYLAKERMKGKDSFWYPFICTACVENKGVYCWEAEYLKELQDPQLENSVTLVFNG